jgi:hypothetical protein
MLQLLNMAEVFSGLKFFYCGSDFDHEFLHIHMLVCVIFLLIPVNDHHSGNGNAYRYLKAM